MKFDQQYPGAQPLDQFPFEGSEIMKGPTVTPCSHCGELTSWWDISFQASFCSAECDRAEWAEYFEALQKTARRIHDVDNRSAPVI